MLKMGRHKLIGNIVVALMAVLILTGCAKDINKPKKEQNWEAFYNLPTDRGIKTTLTLNKDTFYVGEEIEMTFKVDTESKVWLISIGADDKPTILYPNDIEKDNRLQAGEVKLPPKDSKWVLRAVEPEGDNLILAIATKIDVSLDDIKKIILSDDKMKEFEKTLSRWGLSKKVIKIVRRSQG